MPNYGFICLKCQHEWEDIVPMNARDNKRNCPECNSRRTKRTVGAPAVIWEGARNFGYKFTPTDSGGEYNPCALDDPDEIGDHKETLLGGDFDRKCEENDFIDESERICDEMLEEYDEDS